MFSYITMNWRGRPLTSHRTIIELIAATTTETGLTIRAERDTEWYQNGVKISDTDIAAIPLTRHEWHAQERPDTAHRLAACTQVRALTRGSR